MEETVEVEYYETDLGDCPFLDWETALSMDLRALVRKRLNRVRLGNFGDCDHIEGSIYELRIHIGPGYRIYYGRKGKRVVVLLCAGAKKSQKRDIIKAKRYWEDCL